MANWSPVWNCSPFQISQLESRELDHAVHRLHRRVREVRELVRRLELLRRAVDRLAAASPSLRAALPGVAASLRYSAIIASDEPLKPVASSHSTLSASRPFFAAQNVVAMTATPLGISTT